MTTNKVPVVGQPGSVQKFDFNSALTSRYVSVIPHVPRKRTKISKAVASSVDGSGLVEYRAIVPRERYSNFGGIDELIREIQDLIERPFRYPSLYTHLGVNPPKGVLLHGPPGCGKTQLARAVAGELGIGIIKVSAPELVSGMSGESEGRIRDLFLQARAQSPCIIFIDEIDAICPKRETAQREMERRIVAQLLTCMDDLEWSSEPLKKHDAEYFGTDNGNSVNALSTTDETPTSPIDPELRESADVEIDDTKELENLMIPADLPSDEGVKNTTPVRVMVIGATNRPDSIDPALRRAGRFDRELRMGVPTEEARLMIIKAQCQGLRLSVSDSEALQMYISRNTPGFVGADLKALCQEAARSALRRFFTNSLTPIDKSLSDNNQHFRTGEKNDQLDFASVDNWNLDNLFIIEDDFEMALRRIQPAGKREGFAAIPDCKWKDIGALQHVREELRMSVVEPIRYPELFAAAGIASPAGVLLYGPPGCGKTLLARAVASEAHSNFISVKGPELLNKFLGESERGVRLLFERARQSAPCVIFFDELDALCPRRGSGSGGDSGGEAATRVVNQLLTEMDGVEGSRGGGVFVMAATNRPDIIDPAMTRPGRLDKRLYVPLPSAPERVEILEAVGRSTPWSSNVDLCKVAGDPRCEGFSGADLTALVREAALCAVREVISSQSVNELSISSSSDRKNFKVPHNQTIQVTHEHVESAFARVKPSVSPADLARYSREQSMHRL